MIITLRTFVICITKYLSVFYWIVVFLPVVILHELSLLWRFFYIFCFYELSFIIIKVIIKIITFLKVSLIKIYIWFFRTIFEFNSPLINCCSTQKESFKFSNSISILFEIAPFFARSCVLIICIILWCEFKTNRITFEKACIICLIGIYIWQLILRFLTNSVIIFNYISIDWNIFFKKQNISYWFCIIPEWIFILNFVKFIFKYVSDRERGPKSLWLWKLVSNRNHYYNEKNNIDQYIQAALLNPPTLSYIKAWSIFISLKNFFVSPENIGHSRKLFQKLLFFIYFFLNHKFRIILILILNLIILFIFLKLLLLFININHLLILLRELIIA